MKGWKRGREEERSECCLPLGTPVCNSLRSTPLFKTTTFMEVVSNWEGERGGKEEEGRKEGKRAGGVAVWHTKLQT